MSPQTYRLVMRSGPTPGKTYDLNKPELTIGRDTANDIVINDPEISRKHARLVLQGDNYVLEDLGSTNGSFVDGQRLMGPYTLKSGDSITLGENVNLGYEASQFDPDATVVGQVGTFTIPAAPPTPPTPPPSQAEEPAPAYQPSTPPPPAYSAQVPPGPFEVEAPATAEKKSGNRNWILAGCGCLVLVLLCSGVTLVVIDQLN